MGHGVLGTASSPSLEKTMGGLDHTQAPQRVPRTAAGGGEVASSGRHFGQDLHMTLIPHRDVHNSPTVGEILHKLTSTTCTWT